MKFINLTIFFIIIGFIGMNLNINSALGGDVFELYVYNKVLQVYKDEIYALEREYNRRALEAMFNNDEYKKIRNKELAEWYKVRYHQSYKDYDTDYKEALLKLKTRQAVELLSIKDILNL